MTQPHDEQQRRNEAVLQALQQQAGQQPVPVYGSPAQADNVDLFVPPDRMVADEGQGGRWPLAAWVLIDAGIAFGLTVALTLGATLMYALSQGFSDTSSIEGLASNPLFFFVSLLLQSLAFVVVVLTRVVALRNLPLAWLGVHARRLLPAIAWGVVAGIAFLVVNVIFGLLFNQLGSIPDQAAQFPTQGASPFQLTLIGICIVVFAPLVEEIFFRGYAMRAFSQRFGALWGLLLSALLFAAPHALGITTGYIGLLVPIFFGGLILGYVYQRTGSLWSSIVAHAINNGVAFLGLLIAPALLHWFHAIVRVCAGVL